MVQRYSFQKADVSKLQLAREDGTPGTYHRKLDVEVLSTNRYKLSEAGPLNHEAIAEHGLVRGSLRQFMPLHIYKLDITTHYSCNTILAE